MQQKTSSHHQQTTKPAKKSRMLILYGWLIAMLGVLCYCFVMLANDTSTDPYSTIFERGLIGWTAILLLLVGLGLWLVGSVRFFNGAGQSGDDERDL